MKNISFLSLLTLCLNINIQAQTYDTVKVKSSWYARTMPLGVYTGMGYMSDRISQNIEFGRSYGPIDAGLSLGRISLRKDSTMYLQGRITMDACQYGIFSNEFSVGGGCIFNSTTPLMLEVSSTIFAQVGEKWGLGIITGYYDFSGVTHDSNKNFYGIFFRYGLLRSDGGILMNRGRIGRRLHHHI